MPLERLCSMTTHANFPFLNSLAIVVLKNLITSIIKDLRYLQEAASFDAGSFKSSGALLRKGSGSTPVTGKMLVQVRSRR